MPPDAPVSVICFTTPNVVTGLKLNATVPLRLEFVILASRLKFAEAPLEQINGNVTAENDPFKHNASAAVMAPSPVTLAPVRDKLLLINGEFAGAVPV